jgi:hypothetical protein
MARSQDLQQALDIVAGRKPAPAAAAKWGKLERIGVLLWVGVAIMIAGFAAWFVLS